MVLREKFTMFSADYNLLAPDDMDDLFFTAYEKSLGLETRMRIAKQIENYDYYDGKQHKDEYGNLVKADELERPADMDYDPTRYATNYFKVVIDRKARWQMSGEHKVHVPRKTIDAPELRIEEGYETSVAQEEENRRAYDYENLLKDLWRENNMRVKLPQAARDRLIADKVVCKLVFNPKDGKLKWIWRPDYEYISILSDDDFEEEIAGYFVDYRKQWISNEEIDVVKIQHYKIDEDDGMTYLHEGTYRVDNLDQVKRIIPSEKDYKENKSTIKKIEGRDYMPMGIDFIPVVEFAIDELLAGVVGDGEVSELRTQNDILNTMNEDAIDSLKFEMFPITAVLNVVEGTAEQMKVAPGAVIEARGAADGLEPEIRKVESGFKWKDAFDAQYTRVKSSMHEISGLPMIVPQELNFGGLNSEAMHILFQDIIADTEEQWLAWESGLSELHEKTIRYLQARTDSPKFSYDKTIVKAIENYHTEMRFQLPLPDNRKDLVDLVGNEMMNELESQAGAMERIGVDNVEVKQQEIAKERIQKALERDPYGEAPTSESPLPEEEEEGVVGKEIGKEYKNMQQRRNKNGEMEVLCDDCGGSGEIVSGQTGDRIICPQCKGKGWYQPRSR